MWAGWPFITVRASLVFVILPHLVTEARRRAAHQCSSFLQMFLFSLSHLKAAKHRN